MRILFLQDDFPPQSFGGAGISTYELALGMRKLGHNVCVITTCRKEYEAGESELDGIKIFRIVSDYPDRWRAYISINNRKVIKELVKILEKVRPDIIHANNVHTYLSYHSLKVSKRYSKAVIITLRDVMAFNYGKLDTKRYLEKNIYRTTWIDHLKQARKRWNPFRNLAIKYYLGCTDRIFAISYSLKEALVQNGIKNVDVIYNGINTEEWDIDASELSRFRTKYNLNGKKVILLNGRLSPAKGSKQALEAIRLINKEFPEAVLLVAGTGEIMGQNVIFTGWIDRKEIKLVYGVSDMVLMPSTAFDAFGRVNIEAMASKKPVIGTCYGGTPEIIVDGVTGYVVNPLYPEEIAERCILLLRDSKKALKFGEAGFERVKIYFNLEDKVREYINVYRSLLK